LVPSSYNDGATMSEPLRCGMAKLQPSELGVTQRKYEAPHNSEVVRWVPCDSTVVLDVGCGAGGNAAYLVRRGIVVDGVTLSLPEAQSARQWCRRVVLHNLESGLPDDLTGPYDAVLCSHILEHICFPQNLLRDVHARLRRGGKLIVAVPNLLHYKNRLSLLLGRFEYQDGGLMDDTHFRWYTLSTLTKLVQRQHFEVEESYGAGSAPLGPLRKIIPRLCRHIDLATCKALPGLFGWQLIVSASPA